MSIFVINFWLLLYSVWHLFFGRNLVSSLQLYLLKIIHFDDSFIMGCHIYWDYIAITRTLYSWLPWRELWSKGAWLLFPNPFFFYIFVWPQARWRADVFFNLPVRFILKQFISSANPFYLFLILYTLLLFSFLLILPTASVSLSLPFVGLTSSSARYVFFRTAIEMGHSMFMDIGPWTYYAPFLSSAAARMIGSGWKKWDIRLNKVFHENWEVSTGHNSSF